MADNVDDIGSDFREEMSDDPRTSDETLVRCLREEARSLGMLFGVDKAVMRAALVAALPPETRNRAVRLLGSDDPMFRPDPEAPDERSRGSAASALAKGVVALLKVPHVGVPEGPGYHPGDIEVLMGLKPTRRRPR